ncbi:MAG TPA: threonine/serine dehydratase [Candidatus Solibacter sp.]|nr:threonine/serine dehydratase [Candidatus Solibacter sp.]
MTPDLLAGMVEEAAPRIRPFVTETPAEPIPELFSNQDAEFFFKLENLQQTGSFKLRGASNKVLSLAPARAARGVIAASNGNHGLGVAAACRRAGIAAEVYVSSQVSLEKARRIGELGAVIRQIGEDPLEAEVAGRAAAEQEDKAFVSPYNDSEVMAGQGTIAVELQKQLAHIDELFVAVGGGGLIGGIGAYMKRVSPQTRIIGCWPENSRVLYESMKAGRIIDFPEQPTLSESTAGGLEPGSVTLDICRSVIDDTVTVSEQEILDAMKRVRDARGWTIEGAAGVAVAACLKEASHYRGKRVVVVICGGNLSPRVLRQLEEITA